MTFPVFIKASRTRVDVAKEVKEVNRLRLRFERAMTRSIYQTFATVGEAAADEYRRRQTIEDAMRPHEDAVARVFRAHYEAVIETFAKRVYDNRKLTPFGSLIFQLYEREGAAKVRSVSATTKRRILRAIVQGEKEGLGVDKTAKLIVEKTKGQIGRARAATIARTETHAAASYATHAATKELNLPAQRKRWVSVADGRTRSHHASANGQEVGIDEKFIIQFRGVEIEMNYPHDGSGGPANNVNCRCLAIYFTDEDALFSDLVGEEEIQAPPPVEDKPYIDVLDITQARGGLNARDVVDHMNKHMSPLLARVAAMLPKPNKIIAKPDAGVYYRGSRLIETDLDRQIATHEYGHFVDDMIARAEGVQGWAFWSDKGLRNAWEKDRKALRISGVAKETQHQNLLAMRRALFRMERKTFTRGNGEVVEYEQRKRGSQGFRFRGADGASDIIDSFVKGKFRGDYGVYGHAKSYWKDKDNGPNEAFANMFAMANSPDAVKWMEKNIPNLWKAFKDKMEELDANGI